MTATSGQGGQIGVQVLDDAKAALRSALEELDNAGSELKREIAGAIEDAVAKAVGEWQGLLWDPDRLGDLLDRDPHAPKLSEEPFTRRNELEAILRAACELAEVERA